jgi:hypothetical protein
MTFVPRMYINPYGQKPNRIESSKSMFKENNLHSNIIKSVDINQLTNIFENDSIINGLELEYVNLSNNNRTMNFGLSNGRIIQDQSIIEILENINLSIDIFSQYNISEANTTDNYFKISGDQTNNFSEGNTFGIFNSTISGNNHLNWSVDHTEYDGSTYTKIYVDQNISSDNTSGLIVNNNFSGESGQVVLMSKYKFYETLEDNLVEFISIYKNSTNNIYPTFDSNIYRMVYAAFDIQKDNTSYEIISYDRLEDYTSIVLDNLNYVVRNINYTHRFFFDGGVIN